MPRRILMVVNDAAFFLSHRVAIALGARAAGFDVHVATPRDDASRGIEALGLSFHPIPLSRRSTSPGKELVTLAALVRLYRAVRPDLVHHVTAKPILYGGVAARVARVPAVVNAVSGLGYVFIAKTTRAKVLQQAVRAAYGAVTAHPNCAMIFQNEDDRAAFADVLRTDTVAMIRGSGVDLDRFQRTPLPNDKRPIVLLPSRMLWDKGVGEFVGAARELAGRGANARFVLVGGADPGNPASVPEAQLEAWAREGIVEWWGHSNDVATALRRATIVCLPSYREGMPKALLEACAVGRPVVTTDVPGCRDVVGEGTHGVVVPARDAGALAVALGSLLADRPRLERMGGEAADQAARFSVAEVVARTLDVYATLLARPDRFP